jgi:hypothetical protein
MRGERRAAARRSLPVGLLAAGLLGGLALLLVIVWPAVADVPTPVPADQRGTHFAERTGTHDASNIRTEFLNFGMVGNYPPDPGNVDLSIFHSVEVPKGSGMNYCDGITPFVLAKITQADGSEAYIMETGFRERQGISPFYNRQMRFEPRPGYFEPDPTLNPARSPAISNDPRTWPNQWPDRLEDPDDPGWPGSWNGYFGKQIVADQESYMVMDDQYYDAFYFYPDSRDSTRNGLGLRIEVRGFQWANPQARNVIFWHYDITNEGTTDYDDNIIFGIYMDSGVGGSALSCDGVYESDDDNAFFNREFNQQIINLVYTWDVYGHGKDLTSSCARTGYLGYAYLETPGNALDGVDNDEDGITDERRDGGPGERIEGQENIASYVASHYDMERFEITFGALEDRPAYRAEVWWTGDEDMDWTADLHDVGADGKPDTGDSGEGDGMPTDGEPSFDRTDLNESDQIGLTGFKYNRIRPGLGNPNQEVDDILFFTTPARPGPPELYAQFTDPDPAVRFDPLLQTNYNIGFLFASGPFTLEAGQTERFSLALAYGSDLDELRRTVQTVQQIYNANYRFAVPPALPTLTAEAGDGWVRLSWDNLAELKSDPVTGEYDFEGYRIYRSTDSEFRDPQVILTGTGSGPIGNGRPIAQFDRIDDRSGFSDQTVEGVAYYLGTESGLIHNWTDYSVTNGQLYYYAVTAYDFGSDRLGFYPSENAIAVSRTLRGGTILPPNVVAVRPNPKVAGFVAAQTDSVIHISGRGEGSVGLRVVNSGLVRDGHLFKIDFAAPKPDSIRASSYALIDSTKGEIIFERGQDLAGQGIGTTGAGLLPIIATPATVEIDTVFFSESSPTDAELSAIIQPSSPRNLRRLGYPDDLTIVFHDAFVDTGVSDPAPVQDARPAKFQIFAQADTGAVRLPFRFRDINDDGTLSASQDAIDIFTIDVARDSLLNTYRVRLASGSPADQPPAGGDVLHLSLTRPYSEDDALVFTAHGERIEAGLAREEFKPYVVPNPYVGSASFEPERYGISGRGERRLEFRGLPSRATIRIYNVRGELVQTLQQDGSDQGIVAWDLRTKDNLEVAPGLYIFYVESGAGEYTGKFAVIK